MIYFFINLIFHSTISLMLFFVLRHFFVINQQRRNKRWISYFAPVAFSLILLLQATMVTIPRLLASAEVIRNDFSIQSGVVEEVGFLNNKLEIDGKTYYFNPMIYKPKAGDVILYKSTTRARYIVEMSASNPD
ncbi:MAG: hypothetical protein GXY06_07350 [Clostridiaceae bacterium]|nr:hypothetical protein [Clostridiaceae bacterium]